MAETLLAAPAVATGLPVHHSLVSGRDVEGHGGLREAINPATGAPFAAASLLDAAQLEAAVISSQRAARAWAGSSFAERAKLLMAVHRRALAEADLLAKLVAREQGKPVSEAHAAEIFPSLEHLRHLADHAEEALREEWIESDVLLFAHKEQGLRHEPVGVVLAITPWNYPFAIPMTTVGAAVAAGNAVLLKPAPATTLVGLEIGRLFREAGAPEGLVNVVAIDDALAPSLVEDRRVGKIVFTGSMATGRRVMAGAAKNLTPVVLELGGKDPAIVCRDADLDHAAAGVVWGAFMNAGQTCASIERVYVEQPVADAFVAKVVERAAKLKQGDPLVTGTDIGPLTLDRQRAIVRGHVDAALAAGARALVGGAQPDGPGWFYPPTVLVDVHGGMKVMHEETFGPVLPIEVVASVDEAIAKANQSDYGLTASGWTRDPQLAQRLQRELSAGAVTINDCISTYSEPAAPWGGPRGSGVGRTHGLQGLRELTQAKFVTRDKGRRPLAWWYPYDAELSDMIQVTGRALHAPGLLDRVAHQLRLLSFGRFWQRVDIVSTLRRLDRLF